MKNFYKISGIIAGIAFGIGLICLMIGVAAGAKGTLVLTSNGFKVRNDMERWKYSNVDETPFTSIDIQVEAAEIHIIESETDKYTVSFDLAGSEKECTFSNADGTLLIKDKGSSERFAINIFGDIINTTKDVVYVSVPKGVQLEQINIDGNVGDIDIELPDGAKTLSVSADVGEIHVTEGVYEVVELLADVGDVEIEDVEVTEKIKASADVGEVQLKGKFSCDMDVSSNVGSISIRTSLSKEYYRYEVSASLGKVDVFDWKSSGADIEIGGNTEAEYYIKAEASWGSVEIDSVEED